MSVSANPNPIAAVAAHLSSIQPSNSEEEQLYRQALREVSTKTQNTKAVVILTRLQQSQHPEDVVRLFNDSRAANKLWQRRTTDSWSRRVARISEKFLKLKPVGDGLVQINSSIAAPIWTVFCASLSVLEGILQTDESLDLQEHELEIKLKNISGIYIPGHTLPPDLRDAVFCLYKVVIEFSLSIALILQEPAFKSWAGAATREVSGELHKFSRNLEKALASVREAQENEARQDRKDIKHALAFPTISQHTSPVNGAVRHIPGLISNSFVGRQQELGMLRSRLTRDSPYNVPIKTALLGWGGIGKTQLALQYIDRYIVHDPALRQSSVLFIPATSRTIILSNFSTIGERLAIGNAALAGQQPEKLIERVKMWLESTSGWLLVFDSVVDSDDLQDFMPASGNGHVLITTRSPTISTTFAAPEDIIDVQPMDEDVGSALVFRLATGANPLSEIQQRIACDISRSAGGLPLAIEQVVKNAARTGLSLEEALIACKSRRDLLMQQNFCSNHELNAAVGAIVQMSLESLKKDHAKELALFQLVALLEPSSIPLRLLYTAKDELQAHFERPYSYALSTVESYKPLLCLEDESDKQAFQSRMKRLKTFGKRFKTRENDILRVDSDADVELQNYWFSQQKCLQLVLQDRMHVDNAINILVNAGLVRRIDHNNIWVHSLFSELTQKLMDLESKESYRVKAHLVSTMVYLAHPPFSRRFEPALAHFPHLIAVKNRMREIGILNDATIGAEISHLIASTYDRAQRFSNRPIPGANLTTVIEHYTEAYTAYELTCRRIEAATKLSWDRIADLTLVDHTMEERRSGGKIAFRVGDYERLGRNAHWRSINTCAIIGITYRDGGMYDQAIEYLTRTVDWYEKVFGCNHLDTIDMLEMVRGVYYENGDFESARKVALEEATRLINRQTTIEKRQLPWLSNMPSIVNTLMPLTTTESGGGIAQRLGDTCLKLSNREKEAILWYEIALLERERFWHPGHAYCAPTMEKLALAHKHNNDLEASTYWLARAVEASLEDMESNKLYQQDDPGWERAVHDDNQIQAYIAAFREMVATAAELPTRLDSFVSQIDCRAKLWEQLRECHDADTREKKRREDEEFEEFQRKLDVFYENYPPARDCSYIEAMRLFKEKGHLYV